VLFLFYLLFFPLSLDSVDLSFVAIFCLLSFWLGWCLERLTLQRPLLFSYLILFPPVFFPIFPLVYPPPFPSWLYYITILLLSTKVPPTTALDFEPPPHRQRSALLKGGGSGWAGREGGMILIGDV